MSLVGIDTKPGWMALLVWAVLFVYCVYDFKSRF